MTEDLPTAVRAYFDGKNARDFDAAVAAFLPDAVVRDEARTHRGRDAIRAWMEETAAKYADRTAVKRFDRQDRGVAGRGGGVRHLSRKSCGHSLPLRPGWGPYRRLEAGV